jgi:hypothetical protein
MSFAIPYQIDVGTINPNYDNIQPSNHKTYDSMVSNQGPISWTYENYSLLKRILKSLNGNFLIPQLRLVFPDLEEKFVSNLNMLLISLKAYYDSSNPAIPLDDLIDIICEKNAATILKNIRTKSILIRWESSFVEDPDWWAKTPHYDIFDVGDIFYYKHTFFWDEECDDYVYQSKVLDINQDALDEFRKSAYLVLDELDFEFDFEPDEILMIPRSAKVINSKFESIDDYKLRYKENHGFRYGPRHPGKRCIIPVHPGGVRDTIINTIPDLNTILGIEKIVSRCLKNHPNTTSTNIDRSMTDLQNFHDKYQFFYCRDIEKEGITKPRILLKIMLEALSTRLPILKQVCTTDFFDGDWCHINDTTIHSQRGHGLGMANSLTTFMQIIIHRMVVTRYLQDHYETEDFCQFFALNDDCVFGLNLSEEEAF